MKSKIRIFTIPNCPRCLAVKTFLEKQGLAYEEAIVEGALPLLREMISRTGSREVPVTMIGNRYVVGTDLAALERLIAGQLKAEGPTAGPDPDSRPILGLTLGDVAGIGPEVTVKALADPRVNRRCRPVILGDPGAIRIALDQTGLNLDVRLLTPEENPQGLTGTIELRPLSQLAPEDLIPGRPTPATGLAAARYIETGAGLALEGRIKGLVTAPISKEALHGAGYAYPGHTEMLAALAGGPPVVMMLAGERLRVVLATIHVALALVPGLLTTQRIVETALITGKALVERFRIADPHLAVAGLNPHAGESGLFGREEETIIAPAVAEGRRLGLDLTGPYPPDTLFHRAAGGEFDAVVCMYHDQGLIPFKLLHFADGVNVTLGLPFVRTSVDHGTAYDLAGRNAADHRSMVAAIELAAKLAG